MKIEVLVTTMDANDFSLYEKMNIQTDAVIANQSGKLDYAEEIIDSNKIKLITTNTKGLSRNRNIGIAYCTGDIILFCDDDVKLVDNYQQIIIDEFNKYKNIDAVKFYCKSDNIDRPLSFKNPKFFKKAKINNILSAGVVAFAIRREILVKYNFRFHEDLGAGTTHGSGEDSLFLKQLLDSRIKIYLSPIFLANVKQEESSWFNGYDKLFFVNTGYIYKILYGNMALFAVFRRAIKMKKNKKCNLSFLKMIEYMIIGLKNY